MNRIVPAIVGTILFIGDYPVHRGLSCSSGTILFIGDYPVHVNRIVTCEQDSRHEHCMHMASVNIQNSRREQDS